MANRNLFNLSPSQPQADTRNEAGGLAYQLEPRAALAQLAATGTFHQTFYSEASQQLDELLALAEQVDSEYLAKLAIYARERAYMKDMPAALLLVLARRDRERMHRVFGRVVDNGRVLRSLFQMLRSGRFGSRGMSSSLQRAFQRWLNEASVGTLLSASIGNDPSLRDVLRMARPTPCDNERRALFGWLAGRDTPQWAPATEADLPAQVRGLLAYRAADSAEAQVEILRGLKIRWDLLADAARGPEVWTAIAKQMGTQALRMNLNTLLRHGVLGDRAMVEGIAAFLADPDEVRRSRQFPYQLMAAYKNADAGVPSQIRKALEQAAEHACGNVPQLPGPVLVGLDTSGSMGSAVTGFRGHGATSAMRCVDVAALFASAILRRNPGSVVVPFDTQAYQATFEATESILGLSHRLSQYGGGGTDCSLPLAAANRAFPTKAFDAAILVSDNESWVGQGRHGSTAVMTEWTRFRANQRRLGRDPKLVCIDIQPYGTTQAPESPEILNIGGFSDAVFDGVAAFLDGDAQGRFVREVEAIEL